MKTVTIAGASFDITVPYAAGHVLTEAEAKHLNQTRHENVRNNTAKKVKELVDAGDLTGAAKIVADYDASYEFTIANVGAPKLDPIEREARAIAKELIKLHLAKTGRKLTVVPEGHTEESWKEATDNAIAKKAGDEAVRKEAEKVVKAKGKRLESLSEGLEV